MDPIKRITFFENPDSITSIQDINSLLLQLSPKAKNISGPYLTEVMNNSFFFTAVDKKANKTVGMATLTKIWKPTGFFGTLEDIVVDEAYRGDGIGTRLVELVLKKAKRLKMIYVDLTSNPTRINANALYISMGAHKRDTNIYRFHL
jgi:GNAT superfamily N-acetyltransferase